MPIRRLLDAHRERRTHCERDARDLIVFLGELAYPEARGRAREARGKDDRAADRHWSRVAVEIAKRTDVAIGETVDDRYEAERRRVDADVAPRRLHPGPESALADIAAGIADLAHGRADTTTVHNVGAHVRHVIELSCSSPELVLAGHAVIAACEDLGKAGAECRAALDGGTYPEPALVAGLRLQALARSAREAETSRTRVRGR